jgi:hypothetical protein
MIKQRSYYSKLFFTCKRSDNYHSIETDFFGKTAEDLGLKRELQELNCVWGRIEAILFRDRTQSASTLSLGVERLL